MEELYELKEILLRGVKKLDTLKTGDLKMGELEAIKMLTSSIDHLCSVCEDGGEYSEAGYSGAGDYAGNGSSMRSSRNGGYYGRRGRSRSTGRFVSRSGGSYNGSSYAGAVDEVMEHLDMAMDAASDNVEMRQTIQRMKDQIGHMG